MRVSFEERYAVRRREPGRLANPVSTAPVGLVSPLQTGIRAPGHTDKTPGRRFLPKLIDSVLPGDIKRGKGIDLVLPLDQVAKGYRAMEERRAIKGLTSRGLQGLV